MSSFPQNTISFMTNENFHMVLLLVYIIQPEKFYLIKKN